MQFLESPQEAEQYSRAAIACMKRLGIPPHPNNHLLWYCYSADCVPELKLTLDILQSNQREFTPELNDELYDRFFGQKRIAAAAQSSTLRVEGLLQQILRELGAVGGDNARYADTLKDFHDHVLPGTGTPDLQRMVANILIETQRMAEHNQILESHLNRSAGEVETLRRDLVNTRKEALTDALTNIGNRKFFDAKLREAATGSMETGETMSLLMVDIDHFKSFNDRFGHQAGDQVLVMVAHALTDSIKGQDTVARYGGEEFGIILPRTELDGAAALATQICDSLAHRYIRPKSTDEDFGIVTVSIGVAAFRLGEPLTVLIDRADCALYRAKSNGRNRAVAETALDCTLALEGRPE
ncbi:MAG: GGDEF domain-containing protein [Aliidongia sp.]